ncbi:MAG: hypothetical protein JXA69_17690 [Phycisphaerae bacterium]|nr:hypothetical protein [Phycisphaerae bacterium]
MMAKSPRKRIRWWLVGSVYALLTAVAMVVGGVVLAIDQADTTYQLAIESLQQRARNSCLMAHQTFERSVTQALRIASQAYTPNKTWDPTTALRNETADHITPWWCEWFALDNDTMAIWPPIAPAEPPPLPTETAPVWFLEAQDVEFREGNALAAIEIYRKCTGNATAKPWRQRAWTAIAACHAKLGQFNEAIEIYDRLLAETETTAAGVRLLDLHLARVDTLLHVNRTGDARTAIDRIEQDIRSRRFALRDRADAEILIRRIQSAGSVPDAEIEARRQELLDEMERQRQSRQLATLVREVFRQSESETDAFAPAGPGYQIFESRTPAGDLLLVYRDDDLADGRRIRIGARVNSAVVAASVEAISQSASTTAPDFRLTKSDSDVPADAPFAEPVGRLAPDWVLIPNERAIRHARATAATQRNVIVGATAAVGLSLILTVWAVIAGVRGQMRLAQLKAEFVANVSHELKTPLSLIRMFGETLWLGRVQDENQAREYHGIIARESERLTHLIDNILDFSQVQAGRKAYSLTECDIAGVVRDTMDGYWHELERAGFEHHVQIEADLPTIQADANAIAQVLVNLLSNAVKYSGDRKYVAVAVRRTSLGSRAAVEISVEDHGIGLSPADRQRVFEAFFRADDDRVRARRGSGLGLSLVRHTIDAHGGRIGVESGPEHGTTFRIVLPV